MSKVRLERHAYAPELTKLVFKDGGTICACGVKTLAEAKLFYLRSASKWLKYVTVKKVYQGKYAGLNRTYSGIISSYGDLKRFKDTILDKTGHGTKLLNGDILPKPEIIVCGITSKFN